MHVSKYDFPVDGGPSKLGSGDYQAQWEMASGFLDLCAMALYLTGLPFLGPPSQAQVMSLC